MEANSMNKRKQGKKTAAREIERIMEISIIGPSSHCQFQHTISRFTKKIKFQSKYCFKNFSSHRPQASKQNVVVYFQYVIVYLLFYEQLLPILICQKIQIRTSCKLKTLPYEKADLKMQVKLTPDLDIFETESSQN